MKVCKQCNESKPLSEFHRNSVYKNKVYHSGRCKECISQNGKKDYKENKAFYRNRNLQYTFGLSLDNYNSMFNTQGGRCAICGKHQSELSKSLNVDHDHNTGAIRKLLCGHCNCAIGNFMDDIGLLEKAIAYLKEHRN